MRPAWRRWALRVIYWLAVLVLSVAILVALIQLIESRDKSDVGSGVAPPAPALTPV
ncbi:MAG TPA: hypothetical protein VF545_02835 [Thermoleophilaceae bacterium]|jgi:hypothetical protein